MVSTTKKRKTTKEQDAKSPSKGTGTPKKDKRQRRKNKHVGYSLIANISKPKANVTTLVDDWISKYNEDSELAIFYIINFMVEVGGAEALLTYKEFQDQEIPVAADELCDQKESSSFPLGKKTLYNNYVEFMRGIFTKCQSSIFYDRYLLEMIYLWSNQLTVSTIKGIRFGNVVALIQLLNALETCGSDQHQKLNLTAKQLESESSKQSERRNQLESNVKELKSNIRTVEEYIKKIMESCLLDRFRDMYLDIRELCITSLPNLIFQYPSLLLNEKYLYLFGLALNDSSTEIRIVTLRSLIELYSNQDILSDESMEKFNEHFRLQILKIAKGDKQVSVCIQGIELVSLMFQRGLFEQSEIDPLCQNYIIDQPQISNAIGSLLHLTLFSQIDEKIKTDRKGTKNQHRETQLMSLLDFLEKSKASEVPYYLVSAMWGKSVSFFTDWPFFVRFLSDLDEKDLSEKQLVTVSKIINSAVKISCGANIQIFTEQSNQPAKDNQDEIYDYPKSDVTTNFLSILPDLLTIHKSNSEFCENMIEIVQYFKLDTVVESRQQNKYTSLLESLTEQFTVVESKPEVLETIAKTFEKLSHGPDPLISVFKIQLQQLVNQLINEIKKLTTDYTDVQRNDILESIIVNLQRLDQIGRLHNIQQGTEDIHITVLPLIDGVVGTKQIVTEDTNTPEHHELKEKITILASQIISQILMWEMTAASVDSALPVVEPNEVLISIFYQFVARMNNLLSSKRISINLRHFVFKILVETLIFFNPNLKETALHMYSFHVPKSTKLLESNLKLLLNLENDQIINEIKNTIKFVYEYEQEPNNNNINNSNKKKRKAKTHKKKLTNTTDSSDAEESEKETTDNEKETTDSEKETTDNEKDKESHDEDEKKEEIDSETERENDQRREKQHKYQSNLKQLQNYTVTSDQCGYVDINEEKKMKELVIVSIQALQCGLISTEFVGEIIKQVAISPGVESIAILKEYITQLKSRITNMRIESALMFAILRDFYYLVIKVLEESAELNTQIPDKSSRKSNKKGETESDQEEEEEEEEENVNNNRKKQQLKKPTLYDKILEHFFNRLKELLDWLCVEFVRKDSLGYLFEESLKFFFGKDVDNPENPNFLRVANYLIPKLSQEQATQLINRKIVYNEENDELISVNNIYASLQNIANVSKSAEKKKQKKELKRKEAEKKQRDEERNAEFDSSDSDEEQPNSSQLIAKLISTPRSQESPTKRVKTTKVSAFGTPSKRTPQKKKTTRRTKKKKVSSSEEEESEESSDDDMMDSDQDE